MLNFNKQCKYLNIIRLIKKFIKTNLLLGKNTFNIQSKFFIVLIPFSDP